MPASGAEIVKVGVLAFRPKPQTLAQWEPLAVALKQVISDHDFVVEVLTFSELEAAVASRKVDFVLTNPGHYVLLTKRIGMSAPLATLATYENGQATTEFGGVMFSRADQANLNALSDIKGKIVAVTSTDSMGGYQTQAYELSRIGVNLPQDAKLIATGMPHDNVVEAVLAGRADVGFVRTGVLEGMAHEGMLDMKRIKIINHQHLSNFPWQISTQLYPEWPFAALPHIDENLARRVAAAIFMLEENTTAIHAMGIHGFVVPSDYTPVADLLKELRLPPFDVTPRFTLNDIWDRYFWPIISALLAIGLIFLLGMWLLFTRRKLQSNHRVVLLQKQQLQESEAHLNAIIENEPECIKILDRQGRLVQMNPAGLAMIEADSLEQVVGRSLLDVILPEYREAFVQLHKRVLAGEIMDMEFEIQGLKGGHCWLETRAVPMYQKDEMVLLGVTRDITERKKAENALRVSYQNMESLLNSMAEGAYFIDIKGDCTFVNRSFLWLLGYDSPEEIIGKHIHELIHHSHVDGSHYPVSECQMYGVLQNCQAVHCSDEVFWRKNGTAIPVEYWVQPIITNGVMLGAVATFIDITARKQTEESLQMMRFCVDRAGDSIFWIDRPGHILYANDAACTERGYTHEEMLGMRIFDLDPDYQHGVWETHFEDLKRCGNITLKTRHRKKDGAVYPIEVNANYVHIGGHEFNFCFLRNITARNLMEDELKTREEKFRSIIEISPVPMALNDEQLAITYLNPAFIRIFGYSLKDIPNLAEWWLKAYPDPDYREWVKTTWQATFEQAEHERKPFPPMELNICTKEGAFKTVVISAAMIAGSKEHLVVLFDITERKKTDDYEQFRSSIFEQLATNKPLTNILEALALGVEQFNSKMLCSILLLDDEGKHFIKGIAPNLPDFYNEAIEGVEIGVGVGSCGTAAFTGQPVIVENIATHPYWTPYKELAARAGLGACWSQPILSSLNQVLGTFAIYHHAAHIPAASDMYLIEQSAKLASLAIERKQAEIELRIAATAFESQEGMLVTDINHNILRINSAFTAITGYTAEDVVGKNPRVLQSGQHDANFFAAMWESINTTGTWQGEIWNRRKSGEVFPEHLTITAVKDQNSIISNYVATLTDITLRKEAVDKIERLAFYDPLTELPNRRLLQDRLKPALASSHRSGRQGALLFIDMDNFKTLNDTLGHNMGDLLLQRVAQRLESCVREGDTVARLGGDEFVVMLEDLSEQTLEAATQTEIVGNKIMAILNQPYQLDAHEYQSTPSIGATLFNGHEQSSEELLKQADIAMYQAKASGRNALRFFDPQMQATITAHVALEKDLRLALKEDQFILYYQPQVYHSGQIIGAEVLIRWQHPLRGLVSPAEFIPLAEETGLILAIGQWVMETACKQIKIWATSEHTQHLQLAVNVSARQFHQADFVVQVHQILSQNAINPRMLKLELTESLVLDDIDDTIFKMNALRKSGVCFSMDDFGTGYSSLSSLKKLPLDQLKIDQSFVRDISIDLDDAIIVETIIAMANKLNMEVIAEGVETKVQRAFLEQNGCQLFQGYLFSKPVPIEQFELLLKKNVLPQP